MENYDDEVHHITCPSCRHDFDKKWGEIKNSAAFPCPECGQTLHLQFGPETEKLILRWQGVYPGNAANVIIEILECPDGRFRIYLPRLQGVLSAGRLHLEDYWDMTEPYRNVEDAKRDGTAIAKQRAFDLHKIRFESDEVRWLRFDDEPNQPMRDAPVLSPSPAEGR
jgi:hypothetical protein